MLVTFKEGNLFSTFVPGIQQWGGGGSLCTGLSKGGHLLCAAIYVSHIEHENKDFINELINIAYILLSYYCLERSTRDGWGGSHILYRLFIGEGGGHKIYTNIFSKFLPTLISIV